MPLVLDLRERVLHWLDVQSKGQFEMNNVETSKAAIERICPELMAYFASGVRPSMYDLALLHAAARCDRVIVRGAGVKCFARRPPKTIHVFTSAWSMRSLMNHGQNAWPRMVRPFWRCSIAATLTCRRIAVPMHFFASGQAPRWPPAICSPDCAVNLSRMLGVGGRGACRFHPCQIS